MEDKFEKKFKSFLPYIIIIGVVYLFLPALLVIFKNQMWLNYIVLIGVLPLTALGCCMDYARKRYPDIYLAFVAPILWIPSMFLYGIIRDSWFRAIIYLVAYFVCGYLGLLLGDMLNPKKEKARNAKKPRSNGGLHIDDDEDAFMQSYREDPPREKRSEHARRTGARPRRAARPKRVAVDDNAPRHFQTEDPYEDDTLDTATTTEDIDAILDEIHQRRN